MSESWWHCIILPDEAVKKVMYPLNPGPVSSISVSSSLCLSSTLDIITMSIRPLVSAFVVAVLFVGSSRPFNVCLNEPIGLVEGRLGELKAQTLHVPIDCSKAKTDYPDGLYPETQRTETYLYTSLHKRRPPPGASGWEYAADGSVIVYYGNKHLDEHTSHLYRNRRQSRANREYMQLSTKEQRMLNRKIALAGVKEAEIDPVSGRRDRVRDEKPPAMVVHDVLLDGTVELLPMKESNGKGLPRAARPGMRYGARLGGKYGRRRKSAWNYCRNSTLPIWSTVRGRIVPMLT